MEAREARKGQRSDRTRKVQTNEGQRPTGAREVRRSEEDVIRPTAAGLGGVRASNALKSILEF